MDRLDRGTAAIVGPAELTEMTSRSGAELTGGLYAAGGKRALDIVLVLLSLPIVVPVVLLCAVALWFEGGCPFYRQDRLGRDGRVFSIWKLRTMVQDAEACLEAHLQADPALRQEWDDTQKLKHDPRITDLGRLLRATFLDELPQLWNVLRGDMSLVGPRPMMVQQLPLYGPAASYFALRPGITGPWQVGARNQTSFCERARFDEGYCHAVCLWNDLHILLRTLSVVAQSSGC